jgi:hypothetical protein
VVVGLPCLTLSPTSSISFCFTWILPSISSLQQQHKTHDRHRQRLHSSRTGGIIHTPTACDEGGQVSGINVSSDGLLITTACADSQCALDGIQPLVTKAMIEPVW